MKSNQAKQFAAICLLIGMCWSWDGGRRLARAQSPRAEEPRLVAAFRLAPAPDIRPHVRELLREALDGLDASKDVVIRTEGVAACAVLQARMGDSESARKTIREAREYLSNKDNLSKVGQSQVADVMRQLARSCADAGEVEELQEVLKALPDPGRNYRGSYEDFRKSVAQECVIALAKAGKGREALDLAKEIKADSGPEASRIKPEGVKNWVLREIALYHARAGDLKEARKTLDSIPDAGNKVQTMAGTVYGGPRTLDLPSEPGIAIIQDQAGDSDGARQTLKQALELARDIENPEGKTRMQACIACAQARVGDLAGARKTLDLIPKESKNYLCALVAVARAQAAADQAKEALEAVDKLSTPSERIYGLCQIAYGQGQAGDVKPARSTGEKALALALTLPEREQQMVLIEIANARAHAKDIEGALETISKTKYAGLTYYNIAHVQANGGDVKGALSTLEAHAQKGGHYNRALAYIASIQAERGQEKEALAWVRKLTDSDAQCDCLIGVANGLLRAHNVGVRRP